MGNWSERYLDFFERQGAYYFLYNNIIWVKSYNSILTPLMPAKFIISLSKEEAEFLLKRTKSRIIRISGGFIEEKSQWWYIICDRFQDLEQYTSKRRSEINRGLKNCKVELIDADFIAKFGYGVYREAFKRYRNTVRDLMSEQEFIKYALSTKSFDDILHWWGVFVDGRLVGYAHNSIVDSEVRYAQIKLHPDYLVYYPSYALIYTMNKYYLIEKAFGYINDGIRSLFHNTEFQDFLGKKFNFRKAYSRLEIFYSPSLEILVKTLYPFRNYIPNNLRYFSIIRSLLKEEEIRKSIIKKECGLLL